MALRHPQLPGCVLLVHWSVQVNKEGGVTASVELLPKIPQNALQLFQASPVAGAAEAFHSLQRIVGVEGALEAVVMAMSQSHDQSQ
ncbi:centromere protein P [Eucyclogobius newberryi]|uniref:centromere protein P n=1 Tax=Eucyclogobius newberryi TaxID=166745 RepID=UPI003B59E0F4